MKKFKKFWDSAWLWLMAYPIKWILPHSETRWGRNAANAITVFRGIFMTYLFIELVQVDPSQRYGWLVAMFFTQLSDGADGALARGTRTTSDLGSTLDGGVDKYSALLLLGGLIAWIHPEFGLLAMTGLIICMAIIIYAEYRCIKANEGRMELVKYQGREFSSRLPAQIKFGVSMLILGGCWLITDRQTSALLFAIGLPIIMVLTVWSMLDYEDDEAQLVFSTSD